jgi:multidrug efflux pump subunit AcrA (membrane-fusion protein)
MRIVKRLVLILLIGVLFVVPSGCSSNSAPEGEPNTMTMTVERGDILIEVTSVGNLELSHKEDLDFEISGTVEGVMVEEGDYVEKGQQLATLDTSDWEDRISDLEDQLTASERNLLSARISLENAEYALDKAEEETETTVTGDWVYRETDSWDIDIKEMQLELAESRLEDAIKAVEDARESLDEALAESPIVEAPFDGFITEVNVEGGDEILTGTVAVVLADPTMFEVQLAVSEMDIFKVEVGGEAWVEVDAVEGLALPATIVSISPTATISQSLVNYIVTVEVEPLASYLQRLESQREEMMAQQGSSGELPARIQQAIEEGSMTQEEAEEMMAQRQQNQGMGQMALFPDMPENFQLKEGLTVQVTITVAGVEDVLIVPNTAISSRGGQSYVQVVLADGTTEERLVTTGLSSSQYTEIIDGLAEGEEVTVTLLTSSNTNLRIPGMGMMGGPRG